MVPVAVLSANLLVSTTKRRRWHRLKARCKYGDYSALDAHIGSLQWKVTKSECEANIEETQEQVEKDPGMFEVHVGCCSAPFYWSHASLR